MPAQVVGKCLNDSSPGAMRSVMRAMEPLVDRMALFNSHQATTKSREAFEIAHLDWEKALTDALKSLGVKSPVTVAQRSIAITYHLHTLPDTVHQKSIFVEIARRFDGKLAWSHVLALHPFLRLSEPFYPMLPETFDPVTVREHYAARDEMRHFLCERTAIEYALAHNRATSLALLDFAQRKGFSPLKLLRMELRLAREVVASSRPAT